MDHQPPERDLGATIVFVVAIIAVMGLVTLVTFLITFKGRERTLVPDVEGIDLLDALPELHDRGLAYTVVPKFDVEVPKNMVISQQPAPGSVVKQGRVVELAVSRGTVLDRVPNYVGWTLDAVEGDIREVYASVYRPLLRVSEPSYIHASKPEGTVLEQEPAPNTPISGATELHFVVSLGPAGRSVTVADYVGVDYGEAILSLMEKNLPFFFTVDTARAGDPGEIVAQTPKAGSQIPADSLVQLWMKPPSFDKDNEVFDLFQYEVPRYAVRVPVRLELVSRDVTMTLIDMRYHPGGLITVPYVAGENDELVLWVDDREVARTPANRDRR